jgi:hypothetical protein
MKQSCGCCAGLEIVTPEPEANRPGLPALTYRAGTYASFLESMLARLSTFFLDAPQPDVSGTLRRIYPLSGLTTRELNDPSIALLDAWATVADVITFYEERIANEAYLRTAIERRSVLELARLVGYKLRPGVSSSVYLAFTVNDGFDGIIPAATRAQSLPGPGEKPQAFETYEDLPAKGDWNNLKLRLTRPQIITLASDFGTDAKTRDTLYFEGISTNLKTGDILLLVLGSDKDRQVPRIVESVDGQADYKRTEVTLAEASVGMAGSISETVSSALQPFVDDASNIFADSDLASEVATVLSTLIGNVSAAPSPQAAANMVAGIVPQIEEKHNVAARRKFTRLEPWLADLLERLNALVQILPGAGEPEPTPGTLRPIPPLLAASPIANLFGIIDALALRASRQPANSFRLTRSVKEVFAPASDIAPRLLATFHPAAAKTLYKAWSAIETPVSEVATYGMRVKAGLFASNSSGLPQYDANNRLTGFAPPSIGLAWGSLVSEDDRENQFLLAVALDVVSENIKIGSWVTIDRPALDPNGTATGERKITHHRVTEFRTVAMATPYGFSGKSTQLTLNPPWLTELVPDDVRIAVDSTDLLRGTIAYAGAEELELAEEPLDVDIEGDSIELAQLYDGLESGRWIVVSGERTDIPDVTGVIGTELVMISSVVQGSRDALCVPFPEDLIPFSQIYYTTDANTDGDRLVVGKLQVELSRVAMPSLPNQKYCEQVQIAPRTYVNAYVPTGEERTGKFNSFEGLLVNPDTLQPYPDGNLDPPQIGGVFAWRISTQPVHTILKLANRLSYKYDAEKVTIYANVVKATHGQTQGEILGNGDASQPFQKFALHQFPLTYLPAPTPSGAESTLTVRVNEIKWHEAENLFILGPSDRDYITQNDDSDKTTVAMGNGEHGLRVPSGTANVKAVYRSGTGKVGNVQAQQISQMASQPLGVRTVINPLRASGGADHDTRDQARRNVPIGVMALDRLVSVADYVDFARKFAGIGKASARRLTDGRKIVVHLTIAGKDDVPIDQNSDLYAALVQALAAAGDPHQPVQIVLRRLKVLVITAGVKIKPDYLWESVVANLRAALLDLYSFDRRELGQPAFLSEAVSTMQAVPGVLFVDMQKFDAVSESVTAEQLTSLATDLRLRGLVDAELANVDLTATDPAKRILPAELAILAPDIPDTLILTEITT